MLTRPTQSYSTVVSAASSGSTSVAVVDVRVIRQAVQDASEADSRAANVVVFGLGESTGESVTEKLEEILDCVGEEEGGGYQTCFCKVQKWSCSKRDQAEGGCTQELGKV